MSRFMPVVIAVVWSTFVLIVDGYFAHSAYKQYEATSYQVVTGTITHSAVKISHSSKGGTNYKADMAYRYEVGDQKFFGNKVRFGFNMDDRAHAYQVVNSHPVGSDVTVYYNPAQPHEAVLETGLDGSDLIMVLMLTPFNAAMIGFWIVAIDWIRARTFRPIAGGAKLMFDDATIRVRLPRYGPAMWGLVATGGLAFVSMFVLQITKGAHPDWSVATEVIAGVYVAGAVAYLWQWRVVSSGADDLVINKMAGQVSLPATFGRKGSITLDIAEIECICVEAIPHRGRYGNVSYSYAPTLRILRSNGSDQKLADWRDSLRADHFVQWLGKEIGVSVQLSDEARPSIVAKLGPTSLA